MNRLSFTLLLTIVYTCASAGSGGPDIFGYTWIDSQDSGGPVYNWINIEDEIHKVQGLADDNYVGPYTITNSFPFYWYTLDRIYIGSNGYICAKPVNIASPFDFIPSTAGANNIIGAMMTDLDFTAGNPKCYFKDNADSTVISWIDVPFWNAFGSLNSFQIFLNKQDSTIQFNYKTQTGTSASNVVVGIEDITGTIGLQVTSSMPPAGYSILFEPPTSTSLQITDAAVNWVGDDFDRGVFIPFQGTPFEMVANIKNTGNQPLSNFTAEGQILDNVNNQWIFDSQIISSLDPGEDTTITFSNTFNNTPSAATYSFEASITGLSNDTVPANNLKVQEVVLVDTTTASINLSYHDATPLLGVTWQGGDGGIGVYFKPPVYPARLISTEYLVTANPQTKGFYAIIYDDDGPNNGPGTILDSVTVDSNLVNVGTVTTVSLLSNVVVQDGGVFVLWYMGGDGIQIATDLDGPFSHQCYEVLSGFWSNYREIETADFFIDLNVEEFVINDAGVAHVQSPATNQNLSVQDTVTVWLKNYGETTINMFNVNYMTTDGNVNTQIYNSTPLTPGDSTLFSFNAAVSSSKPNDTLCVWTSLLFDDLPSNDTLCIPLNPSQPGDVGVIAINTPPSGAMITGLTTVMVDIKNFGGTQESFFQVGFNVGGGAPYVESYTGVSIGPGQTVSFTFNNKFASADDGDDFCAWTDKSNDNNTANDQFCHELFATGIKDDLSTDWINVYPNPVSDHVNFDISQDTRSINIELFDVTGQLVIAEQHFGITLLDLTELPAGVYTYRVNGENRLAVGKLIKIQ
ncbi:MAG: T9SS type A sorting domain-containing protein [Bacteroidetes bacterium]|nr:T9SS type A sorting domain-containing protein [Bacteroidota bacterium]